MIDPDTTLVVYVPQPSVIAKPSTVCKGIFDMRVPEAELTQRRAQVMRQDENYDHEERLLKKWFGSAYSYNWYTRDAYAHPTRDSLSYAVALLDTYDDKHLARAGDVIARIIEIQEDNPDHEHFGVWPHLMEEPLGQGPYVDRNWADFLGKDLIHVMIYHKERLPGDLVESVETSLRRACEAIRIRNVSPGYTNIAVMGSYDTLVAGEILDDTDLISRGVQRVRDLHAFVKDNGTFTEYNSPTYTMVALRDLATFRHHVRHPESKSMIDDLFRLSWEIVVNHFHPTTRQWAGPNSRSYNALKGGGGDRNNGILRTIEEWTSAAVDLGMGTIRQEPEWACMDARCPAELESRLVSIDEPRELVERVVKRKPLSHIATTYITPRIALGTINHQDTWNQRRNVLAYWGTHEQPSCLKVRLIYNGYDLSTGAIWTQQDKHCVLGAVTFATDGGGKHLSLEKLENGTFEASELALRFEFSGSAADAQVQCPSALDEPARVTYQDVDIGIHIPYAKFDGSDVRWETVQSEDGTCLDVTIHRGEPRTFVLPDIDVAVVSFALQVGGTGTIGPAQASIDQGTLKIEWDDLGFSVPIKPDTYSAMRKAVSGIAG